MITFALAFEMYLIQQSGCSAVGSALRSGRRGRKFESCHPDKATAEANAPKVYAMIDKLAKIGVIHRNKAANLKSGLANFINKLS